MNTPKIKIWHHSGVNPDGKVDNGGAVGLSEGIKVFRGTCSSSHESNFIVASGGYNAKLRTVSGATYYFNNTKELDAWLEHQAYKSISTLVFPQN